MSVAIAQSLNPATPAPVRSNSVIGKIAARDLGDARLTDHYYAFTGTPGDLLITIQSRNLNGDLDVFTAVGLRPLLKLTMYAESTAPITKGIYLRKREDLILRIEARSPNDDEGSYQLSFGGSFEPVSGGPDITENTETTPESAVANADRKTKRVSSVGARLPEPEPSPEVAAAPTPTATPTISTSESSESPTLEKKEPAPKATASKAPARGRRPPGRRTTAPTPVKPKVAEKTTAENTAKATSETKTQEETPAAVTAPKPKPTARNTARRGASTVKTPKPEPPAEVAAEPESGPRLIIETNDGTLINRSMSSVRRVIVEGGLVVVTGKDGKIERIPLTNVVRMSIAQ